jgi:hypothetical protein
MPLIEFEPTTPVSERAKRVQAIVTAATVLGNLVIKNEKYIK